MGSNIATSSKYADSSKFSSLVSSKSTNWRKVGTHNQLTGMMLAAHIQLNGMISAACDQLAGMMLAAQLTSLKFVG